MNGGPTAKHAVTLPGPAGALEGLLEVPAGWQGGRAGVVCHPHPLYQGTMMNKVVHTLCRVLHECGAASLRFNFRGVGRSEGAWDGGRGELDDAVAAYDWLGRRYPAARLSLAGFSFGAAMSIGAAVRLSPAQLISVAPAPAWLPSVQGDVRPRCPWVIVQGQADEVVSCEEVCDWVDGLDPRPDLCLLPGVGHFFHGRLGELREMLVTRLQCDPAA